MEGELQKVVGTDLRLHRQCKGLCKSSSPAIWASTERLERGEWKLSLKSAEPLADYWPWIR